MKWTKLVQISLLISMFVLFATPALAAPAPAVFNQTKILLNDLLTWLLILVPSAAALTIGMLNLQKMASDGDSSTIMEKNRRMKQVLIAAVIAEAASGFVTAFLAYYK